jgi:glutathione S-transferase
MDYVAIVLVLVLLEYSFFTMMVGKARDTYGVSAPAATGHEVFERYYRVQQNTLEQLILFVPGIFLFALYVHALTAAGLGVVFFIGRLLYYKSYVADPKSRGIGFLLSFLPANILLIGGMIGAILKLI